MDSPQAPDIAQLVSDLIAERVAGAGTMTRYRAPLVAYARADDPRFADLPRLIPGYDPAP